MGKILIFQINFEVRNLIQNHGHIRLLFELNSSNTFDQQEATLMELY